MISLILVLYLKPNHILILILMLETELISEKVFG